MLDQVLTQAIPLRKSTVLPDPWGWGFEVEIIRIDATGYQEAEDGINPMTNSTAATRKAIRKARVLSSGSRRGKGGVPKNVDKQVDDALDEAFADVKPLTLDMQIPLLAEHACVFKEVPDQALQIWPDPESLGEPGSDSSTNLAMHLLTKVPTGPNGMPLVMPAAFRYLVGGEHMEWKEAIDVDDHTVSRVWKTDEVDQDKDQVVPYGGAGWGYEPTLNRMLAAWIRDVFQSEEYFEDEPIAEGIDTIRPTSSGNGPNSESKSPATEGG